MKHFAIVFAVLLGMWTLVFLLVRWLWSFTK